MHSATDPVPPRRAAFGQPHPALESATEHTARTPGETTALRKMIAGLIHEETALYAITRQWRYDTAGRKFVRLHALLDEQYSEIGTRLTRLAARSHEVDAGSSIGQVERAPLPRTAVADGAGQASMIRELLRRHEMLIANLKRGSTVASGRFHDQETTGLMLDLTANHEKDAFTLRALLWEVEKVAP